MDSIKEAFSKVKQDMDELRFDLLKIRSELSILSQELVNLRGSLVPTQNTEISTTPTQNPTNQQSFKPLNGQISPISIGNQGVPTNKQTNKPTNQHMGKGRNIIDSAADILDSLDSVKKEIRLKFKRLTDQEFLVFSTLYALDEEGLVVDYKSLAEEVKLTEISIRDYIGKLIKKGIPIEKQRINNKNIKLSVSPNLKKVATLTTILQLREI